LRFGIVVVSEEFALCCKSDMMDKIQVFIVGGHPYCGHIDFDTNVFVWGRGWGKYMHLPLSMQNTQPDEQEQDPGLGI
jgi:hypothetical protein